MDCIRGRNNAKVGRCCQCRRDCVLFNQPTRRELDAWRGVALGLSNTDIATELTIGISGVEALVQSLYSKLQCENRVQLARKHWLNHPTVL